MEDLLNGYYEAKSHLIKLLKTTEFEEDKSLLRSMIIDVEVAIELMETGYRTPKEKTEIVLAYDATTMEQLIMSSDFCSFNSLEDSISFEDEETNIENNQDNSDHWQSNVIDLAFNILTKRQMECLEIVSHGCTYSDGAKMLNIKKGSFSKNLVMARRKMKMAMGM